jgi:hypothetical protein
VVAAAEEEPAQFETLRLEVEVAGVVVPLLLVVLQERVAELEARVMVLNLWEHRLHVFSIQISSHDTMLDHTGFFVITFVDDLLNTWINKLRWR